MDLGDIRRCRRQAGSDRPDRLVGDRPDWRRSRRPAASRRAGGRALQGSCRPRARRAVSPMQTMAVKPARQAACALARTSASVSWSARRSEWPTITACAPASASISAEMSPVRAPDGSAWQSCAPISTGEPRAAPAKCRDQRRRRADHQVDLAGKIAPRLAMILAELSDRGRQPVHLPIARDQRDYLGSSPSNHPLLRAVIRPALRKASSSARGRSFLSCKELGRPYGARGALGLDMRGHPPRSTVIKA